MDCKDNMNTKEWHEERDASDAPVWMSADEANGWASGWNAAVEAAKAQAPWWATGAGRSAD